MATKGRFSNRNLNSQLGQRPTESRKSFGGRGGFATLQGGDSRRVAQPVGAAAAPMPVNTSSLRRENNGMDPNIALVPKRPGGTWSTDQQNQQEGQSHTVPAIPLPDEAPSNVHVHVPMSTPQKSRAWADYDDDDDDDDVMKNSLGGLGELGGLGDSLGGLSGNIFTGDGLLGDVRGVSHGSSPFGNRERADSGGVGGSWRDSLSSSSPGYTGGSFNGDRFGRGGGVGFNSQQTRGNFGGDARGDSRERSGSYGNDFRSNMQSNNGGFGGGISQRSNFGGDARGGGTPEWRSELGGGGFSGGPGSSQQQGLEEAAQKIARQQKAHKEAEQRQQRDQQAVQEKVERERRQQEQQRILDRSDDYDPRSARGQAPRHNQQHDGINMQLSESGHGNWGRAQRHDAQGVPQMPSTTLPRVVPAVTVPAWGGAGIASSGEKKTLAEIQKMEALESIRLAEQESKDKSKALNRNSDRSRSKPGSAGVDTNGKPVQTEVSNPLGRQLFDPKSKTYITPQGTAPTRGMQSKGGDLALQGRNGPPSAQAGLLDAVAALTANTQAQEGKPRERGPSINGQGREKVKTTAVMQREGSNNKGVEGSNPVPAVASMLIPESVPAPVTPAKARVIAPIAMPPTPPMPQVSAEPTQTKIIRASTLFDSSQVAQTTTRVERRAPTSTDSVDPGNQQQLELLQKQQYQQQQQQPQQQQQQQQQLWLHLQHQNEIENMMQNDFQPSQKTNPLEGWVPRDNRDITRDMYDIRDNRELARDINLARGVPGLIRDIPMQTQVQQVRRPLGGFGFGSVAGADDSAAAEVARKEKEKEQAILSRGLFGGRSAPRERETRESQPVYQHQQQRVGGEFSERNISPIGRSAHPNQHPVTGSVPASRAPPSSPARDSRPTAAGRADSSAPSAPIESKRERARREKMERLSARMDTDQGAVHSQGRDQLPRKGNAADQSIQVKNIMSAFVKADDKSSTTGYSSGNNTAVNLAAASDPHVKERKPKLSDEEFAAQKLARKAQQKASKNAAATRSAVAGVGMFTLNSKESNSVHAKKTHAAVDSDDEKPSDQAPDGSIVQSKLSVREIKRLAKKEKLTLVRDEKKRERLAKRAGAATGENGNSEEGSSPAADLSTLSDLGMSIDKLDLTGLVQLPSPAKVSGGGHSVGTPAGDIDGDLYGAASCLDDDMPSHIVVGYVLGGILDDLGGQDDEPSSPAIDSTAPDEKTGPSSGGRGGRGDRSKGRRRGGEGRGCGRGDSSSRGGRGRSGRGGRGGDSSGGRGRGESGGGRGRGGPPSSQQRNPSVQRGPPAEQK